MGTVLQAAEVALITVAAVLMLAVAWLWLRRRWLSRAGATFSCSLRRRPSTPSSRWVLGVARYRDHELEWFPSFSLSLWPDLCFDRGEVRAGEQRLPTPAEAGLLLDSQRILGLDGPSGDVELAMETDSLTGLLSWLEAAPPGMRYRLSPTSPE
ncbi:DUF2550 domain-containing protein [Micropruina sp.]|uniref:DUF2550 domain-containing protein n=1 Tax=Micropruina sp. TaxID=2737536 RepID=UPI0039E46FF5